MKRTTTVFGMIQGVVLWCYLAYGVYFLYYNPTKEGNQVLGYTIIVAVFSIVFFGIRDLRNKKLGGKITFGKAFKTGALIALIGSTMYVFVWLFYYHLFVPDFVDKYTIHVLAEATRDGATEAELASKTQEMSQFEEQYKNPLFLILITYFEVLPIGLIVALISSFILKRK